MEQSRFPAGTWVEIEQIILRPEERAPGLPPDTARTPLLARVKGFLLSSAALGGEARVRTVTGRETSGILREVNPAYRHGFGEVVPELLTAGKKAREILHRL